MRILILLFLVTACSSYVRTLGTRMISPETSSGWGNGTLDVRLQSSKRDRLNFDNDKTNNKIENYSSPYSVSAMGELGVIKRLDLFVLPSMFLTPSLLGAKVQVLGDEKKEAKRGNFSVAVMGAAGSRSDKFSSSGDLDDLILGNVDKLEVNTVHREIGLIAGYRWQEKFLHYVNGVYINETVDGKVTTDSNVLNDTKFKYHQNGMIYSTGFIWYFGTSHWKVDYSHFVSNWSKTGTQYTNSVNTALGFDW